MVDRVLEELRVTARNMERYPFESATMAEAGRLAANALRNIAEKFESEDETPPKYSEYGKVG